MASPVRAAVLVKPKTLEAREFARPAIGADDALLRIEACGICGSDYEQYEGAQPQHEDYTPYPVIPGHEPLGLIEEIGANAHARWGVVEGDRVAVRSGYGCGRCEACVRWEPRLCPKRGGTYGYTDVNKPPQLWGGYAERMYLSPYSVVKKMDPRIYKELTIRGVLSMPVDETFRAIDLIESGRYPLEKMHTLSFPLEQAEEAIHALAGHVPGVNPIHLAIVPGAQRVTFPR